jgi:MFS family permease
MRLPARMMTYNLCWAAAGFAAFFTRGALEQIGWWTIFAAPATALILSLAVLALWATLRQAAVKGDATAATDSPAVRRRALTLLHMAWLGNALAYVGINVITPVLMRMADAAGIRGDQLALAAIVTSVWGFSRVAGFVAVGRWTRWHYKARWLVGSQFALAATFLLMMVVHSMWVLVLAQIIFGLSTALIYSSSLYYAMHTSEGSGGHAGFHEALIGLGIFVGPAVGALAGGDLARIGWAVTVVLVAGATVMAWMGAKEGLPE